MGAEDYKLITERVGLPGAVALLVGTAIGMSIFVVPTQMTAEAGPSIVLAILVSIPPMILGVLLLLQMGGAIPVAGGIYVYASRLVGPFWGLIGVAIPVIAVTAYLIFAAMGFANYLTGVFLDPSLVTGPIEALGIGNTEAAAEILMVTLAAWLILGLFLFLNYVGIQLVTKIQIGLVLILLAGLVTFIIAGALSFDPDNLTPMFPDGEMADGEPAPFSEGMLPFIVAIVTLYIPFQGFSMIIEIGEELEDPIKNIPRVLGVGMAIVAVISVGLVVALVGAVPWEDTIVDGEPVAAGLAAEEVGGAIMPGWAVLFVAVAALVAAATTVNTLLTSYSRTIMRAARDEVVPKQLAAVHGTFNTPYKALLMLGLPAILLVPVAVSIDVLVNVEGLLFGDVETVLDWLVVVVVTGIFIAFMIGGVALWRLPQEFPARYEHSFYKLPMPVLKVVAVGNVLVSFIFTIFVATTAPTALVFVLLCMVIFGVVHVWRVRRYEAKGIDLKRRMALLDKHERVGETSSDE